MQIQTKIIKPNHLGITEKQKMLALHQQYYDQVVPDIFFHDLGQKDWVIIMTNQIGQPLGFSTIQLIPLEISGIRHIFLFSGDTVVKEEIRNLPLLAGAFIHFMYTLISAFPVTPLHWFLITKGYRTYRFLPVYFKEYYPVYNKSIPLSVKEILDKIAFFKFGQAYNPETLLIRTAESDRLKPGHAKIPEGKLKDPAIRFFCDRNPLFYEGDELACIADIKIDNFMPMVERIRKHVQINFDFETTINKV
jgi:hypothetical protein